MKSNFNQLLHKLLPFYFLFLGVLCLVIFVKEMIKRSIKNSRSINFYFVNEQGEELKENVLPGSTKNKDNDS